MQVGMQIVVDISIGEFEDWGTFWKYWEGLSVAEKVKYMDAAHNVEIMQETPWKG